MKPSDDLHRKELKGKDVQSCDEIAQEVGLNESTVRKHARKMVSLGVWEEGWRKSPTGWVKVFRKVK